MKAPKNLRRVVLGLLLGTPGLSAASAVAPSPPRTLQTERYTLELSPRGSVLSLVHRPTGTVLLTGSPDVPLYELGASGHVTSGLGKFDTRVGALSEPRENNLQASVRSEPVETAEGRGYRFISEHDRKVVTCDIVVASTHGGISFRIRIQNESNQPIGAIRFPYLLAPEKIGADGAEDVILSPELDGGLIRNPREGMKENPTALSVYPGNACCQLTAFYNPRRAGVSIACHDANGNGKGIGAVPTPEGRFDFSVWHFRPETTDREITVAYPVVIDTFTGDWWQAAQPYRAWSLRQPWARERLFDSKKVPDYFRRGLIYNGLWTYREHGWDRPAQADSSGNAAALGRNRKTIDLAQMVYQHDWSRYGKWVGQDFLPPRKGYQEFEQVAARIRETGNYPMIYLPGFKHQVRGEGFNHDDRFWREMAPFATRARNGAVLGASRLETRDGDRVPIESTRMCLACDYTKRLFLDTARTCVKSGYPIIHLDVHNGGNYAATLCYARDHGHPLGGGPWIAAELARLFQQAWRELGDITPEFALSMEQPSELFMPYLTLGQSRWCVSKREFPVSPPLSEPVPLLMFLHHEHFFGWVEGRLDRSTPENQYFALAKAFVAGQMPGFPGSGAQKLRENPEYQKMFQRCVQGYTGYAQEALFYGRMMIPCQLNVPDVSYAIPPGQRNEHGGKYVAQYRTLTVSGPAVLNSVWLTPTGRTYVVFINHTARKHSFTVDLTTTPGWSDAAVPVFSDANGSRPLRGSHPAIELPAHAMGAIEFKNGIPLTKEWEKESFQP